ncbi:MAG: radical SAM protein [bacterium]
MDLKFLNNCIQKISIEMTNVCNLNCKGCFLTGLKKNESIPFIRSDHFFSLILFKRLIKQLGVFNNFNDIRINLSGGEPFLNPEIFDILKEAKRNRIKLVVFTNGSLLNKNSILKLIKNQTFALMFSIDGTRIEHDYNRGKGNFDRLFKVIEVLELEKKNAFSVFPQLTVNTLISKLNINSFDGIIPLVKKFNFHTIAFSLVQWSDSLIIKKSISEILKRFGSFSERINIIKGINHGLGNLKQREIKVLVNSIKSIKQDLVGKSEMDFCFFPDFSSEIEFERWFSKGVYRIDKCSTIFEQIRIDYNGDVFPACSVPFYKLGNIYNEPLLEILNGKTALHLYKEIKKNGFFYLCQRCCRRSPESITLEEKND